MTQILSFSNIKKITCWMKPFLAMILISVLYKKLTKRKPAKYGLKEQGIRD